MGAHIIDGQFQSDKYPTTPPGKVPLSVKDATAQDLLWEYAQRRRRVDAEFSADLETALRAAGFIPLSERPDEPETGNCERCEKPTPIEDLVGHGDYSYCPVCDAEWRALFAACEHEWEPGVNEHGDPGQICNRCSGYVADEDFPDMFGKPAPARPAEPAPAD